MASTLEGLLVSLLLMRTGSLQLPVQHEICVDFGDPRLLKYDAYLLDQFGVIHDGKKAYTGSAECVRWLQEMGKRICVLSNSSKRRRDTIERLHQLECGMATYLDVGDITEGIPAISVFTSGDLVFEGLRAVNTPGGQTTLFDVKPGSKAFVFGNGDDDEAYLRATGVTPAPLIEADFILARGLFQTFDGTAEDLDFADCEALLRTGVDRGLVMIVANPDIVRPDGRDSPMPGQLAARYETLGGTTVKIGKPHPAIYDAALGALASVGISSDRVAAVGDSMHHDVLGAHTAGIDSIFISGGIHAVDLGVVQGMHQQPDPSTLTTFFNTIDVPAPTFVVPGFFRSESSLRV